MIHEKLVKKTTILKTLDRIKGSEGHEDYFVIHEDRVRYCMKLDFATNFAGQPTGFFVRIRIIPDAKIDLYNMKNWFKSNFNTDAVIKKLSTKFIKGGHLTLGDERVSFVLVSEIPLSDYGDPSTKAGYDKLMESLTKDFDNLGNRILRSLGIFCKTNDKLKALIVESMKDFMTMYAPANPDDAKKPKAKKASVTAITKKAAKKKGKETMFKEAAEEIFSDIIGEPTTIEFADDGDPKIKPKK